jgi:hypothetical protein
MNVFDGKTFGDLIAKLERATTTLETVTSYGQGGTHLQPMYQSMLAVIREVGAFASAHDFAEVLKVTIPSESHLVHVQKTADVSTLAAEVRHARDAMLSASGDRKFLRVASQRADYVDNKAFFGADVHRAFPSARYDILHAGNCLAADENTAAVFHMMRAVEWGLRALAVDLGFRRLRSKHRKSGKVTYTPLAYSEWEGILNQLQTKVDGRITTTKRGPKKQLHQEFYFPVLQDIKGIRDAWRNHVMHTRREYIGKEADAIHEHVQRLMSTLATRAAEV